LMREEKKIFGGQFIASSDAIVADRDSLNRIYA
jgi:hypothetical protein